LQEQRSLKAKDTKLTQYLQDFNAFAIKVKEADGLRLGAEEDARAKALQIKLNEQRIDDMSFMLQSKDQTILAANARVEKLRTQVFPLCVTYFDYLLIH
jgi:hypothetical protein